MTLEVIATYAGWAIAGVLAIIGVFNTQRRRLRVEDDTTAANLIANLKTTTELQEKEIVSLREREVEQGKQIANLQGRVQTLSEILQGRDPAMQAFLDNAPKLAKDIEVNRLISVETAKMVSDLASVQMKDLTDAVKMLVELLTPKTKTT